MNLRLKISNFTIIFVYCSLFVMLLMWAGTGCGPGPTSNQIPDFYAPQFNSVSVTAATDSVTLQTVSSVNVKVIDNSGKPTVYLYAKKYGDAAVTDYTKYTMTSSNGTDFQTKLPADYVSFVYYFTATDGINKVNYPSDAPSTTFQYLKGVPVVSKDYYGTAPALVSRQADTISVAIEILTETDYSLSAGYPKFEYRLSGSANYTTVVMAETTGVSLEGYVIPKGKIYITQLAGLAEGKYEYRINYKNALYDLYYPANNSLNTFSVSNTLSKPPVARIRQDLTKHFIGEINIKIDGTDSYSPDGLAPLTYTWKQTAGSTVTLSQNNSIAYFTPSKIGTYTFTLQVADPNGLQSNVVSTNIEVTNSIIPSPDGITVPQIIDSTEITLTKVSSPYTVVKPITVRGTGVLKIERGVELKFDPGTGIVVENDGALNADGDSSNKIIMKSSLDITGKNQWEGIKIMNDQRFPLSSFNWCDIQSAKTGIYVSNSKNPTISNCGVSECGDGIISEDSTVTITQNIITSNGTDGISCIGTGTAGRLSSISTVSNNTVSKNKRYGIRCLRSRSEISKNTTNENTYGIYVSSSNRSNGNIINVFGNKAYKNTDGLRIENSDPVIASNDIYLNNDNGIICNGSLPQITSNGIHNNRDSGIQMVDCDYRGGNGALVNRSAASLYSCEVEIAHNVISFSGADGIELEGSNPIINHNLICANANAGVYVKSYAKSDGTQVINDEQKGLLIINNLLSQNARSGIARNGTGTGAGWNAGTYFANMAIMINNNNFYANSNEYFDIANGRDLSGDSKEVYFALPFFDDTNSVAFKGISFAAAIPIVDVNGNANGVCARGSMALHAKTFGSILPNLVTWNDGRNLRVDPKIEGYGNVNGMASDLESPLTKTWRLRDIATYPRNGAGSVRNVIDGGEGDVSLMINSGTSYSYYGSVPNTDIGPLYWIGTIYESIK
ncbi:MAG: NosD domain-containing protein [Candidatus Wallbacteria bacterium]